MSIRFTPATQGLQVPSAAVRASALASPTCDRLMWVPGRPASSPMPTHAPGSLHPGQNRASLLFDYIDRFLADASEGITVWLDILAVNQHPDTAAHQQAIMAFSDVIKTCGSGTIVVTWVHAGILHGTCLWLPQQAWMCTMQALPNLASAHPARARGVRLPAHVHVHVHVHKQV